MRFILLALIMQLAVPAAGQGVLPDLEKVFTIDGGWRFAGPHPRDGAPELLEIKGDGIARIYLYSGGGAPKYGGGTAVAIPFGTPRWGDLADADIRSDATANWPDSVPVGNDYLEVDLGSARAFAIRGTAADSLRIVLVTASRVVATCSSKR